MKIIVLNTDYTEFLNTLYEHNQNLEQEPYDAQMNVRMGSLFGVADFYSRNLRKLGHDAIDIHANNETMQMAWAREHGINIPVDYEWVPGRRIKYFPWLSRRKSPRWMYQILAEQIKHYKPDILLNQTMDGISTSFFKEMKPYIRFLVGQHAAPMPSDTDYSSYDLFVSSLPNFCDYFRRQGIRSELCRLAFEPLILDRLGIRRPSISISFVGSLSSSHSSRTSFLESLCNQTDISIWGNIIRGALPKNSVIHKRFKKPVWGLDMYEVLHRSIMTLNYHIGISESYANNMRLYEATGVGTLLITDWKENLHELFDIGKEVIAYRTLKECAELIDYYQNNPDEAEIIARAGQQKTLRDHTYAKRMEEFIEILKKYL